MRIALKLIVLVCATLGLGAPAHAKLKVVTTTQDLAAIARAVGGPHIEAESLTSGNANPHFAEAKPSMIRKAFGADLLLVIGAEMEAGWLPPLLQSARNARIQPGAAGYLSLADSIALLDKRGGAVSRAEGDVHAQGNPHYWLDPRNGVRMAQAIATRLAQIDGAHAQDYRANAQAFAVDVERRYAQWQLALAPLKGKPVITYHTSLAYFAAAFGLRVVSQVEPKPGIPPDAAHLRQLLATIQRERVQLLLMEPYYERRSADYLAKEAGIKLALLPTSVGARPDISDYGQLFDAMVAAIRASGALP